MKWKAWASLLDYFTKTFSLNANRKVSWTFLVLFNLLRYCSWFRYCDSIAYWTVDTGFFFGQLSIQCTWWKGRVEIPWVSNAYALYCAHYNTLSFLLSQNEIFLHFLLFSKWSSSLNIVRRYGNSGSRSSVVNGTTSSLINPFHTTVLFSRTE